MSDTLTDELRTLAGVVWPPDADVEGTCDRAADRIESQAAELAALRAELADAYKRIEDICADAETELKEEHATIERLRKDAERRLRTIRSYLGGIDEMAGDKPDEAEVEVIFYAKEIRAIFAALGSQPEGSQVAPGADAKDAKRWRWWRHMKASEASDEYELDAWADHHLQSEQPKEGG